MTNPMNIQTGIRTSRLWGAFAFLLISCGLLAAAIPLPQVEDGETRRLWNKQFLAAREQANKLKPKTQAPTAKAKPPTTVKRDAKLGAVSTEILDAELLGITIWRLRAAVAGDDRILVQRKDAATNQYALERITADTPFKEGQLVRISIEVPRKGNSYLYVIDRELYDNGAMGGPYLIFPAHTTPRGDNVITAGRSVYVPAQGDPIPYFTLERSSMSHVGERLTIIISPDPLPVNVQQPTLDPSLVARWERQWGGPTERSESRGGAGKQWTKEEQEADEGKRKLVQSDPLPQTIYRVRAKPGGRVLVTIPLQIAP